MVATVFFVAFLSLIAAVIFSSNIIEKYWSNSVSENSDRKKSSNLKKKFVLVPFLTVLFTFLGLILFAGALGIPLLVIAIIGELINRSINSYLNEEDEKDSTLDSEKMSNTETGKSNNTEN